MKLLGGNHYAEKNNKKEIETTVDTVQQREEYFTEIGIAKKEDILQGKEYFPQHHDTSKVLKENEEK